MGNPEGQIVKELRDGTLIATGGYATGIEVDALVVVFRLGEEIIDPMTKENLGALEQVIGQRRVHHVQERLVQLRPLEQKTEQPGRVLSAVMAETSLSGRQRDSLRIQVGDRYRVVTLDNPPI